MSFILDHLTDAVAFLGAILVIAGLAMIYVPLGYIAAGATLVAIGIIGSRRS